MNGNLMRFELPKGSKLAYWRLPHMHVYNLNLIEKMRWLFKKRLFEICIGKHWTYPDRKQGVCFKIKKPRWFWKIVFKLYYLMK